MTTIIAGAASTVTVQVQLDGAPVPVSGAVTAALYSMDGRTVLVAAKSLTSAGSWAQGLVPVAFTDVETQPLERGDVMLVLSGAFGLRRYRVIVDTLAPGTRNSLFIRDIVVDELRRDRLMAAAAGVLQDVKVSDDYLWDKVRAAEADISHTLRVPLVPTRYFPIQPTGVELAAVGDMAWEIDPGYDYDSGMFQGDRWGYLVTRNAPVISVQYMRFCYPSQTQGFFDVPLDWLRVDSRPGHIRMVPSSSAVLMGTAGFAMSSLLSRQTVPDMVQVSYTAGLRNAAADYPELLDAVKKQAVLKVVADAYLPQSGSISADGLSQSLSVDMGKYSEAVSEILNGPKGANGGLMTKIHGIRLAVL